MSETTSPLSQQKCEACRVGAPPATTQEIKEFQSQSPNWQVVTIDGEPRVQREYSFPDFVSALEFTNKVGAIAEEEGHHPALTTEWGKVLVGWWTHKIKDIHRNDLIMAAKTDKLYGS